MLPTPLRDLRTRLERPARPHPAARIVWGLPLACLLACLLLLAGCGAGAQSAATPPTATTATAPQVVPPQVGAFAAYDAARGQVALYSGAAVHPRETWLWAGSGWRQAHPIATPPDTITITAMAYDAQMRKVIMLGTVMLGGAAYENQMWAWDGATWTRLHPSALPTMLGGALADDTTHQQLVLFGGVTFDGRATTPVTDTWTWNGLTWFDHQSSASPPSSPDVTMANDPTHGVVTLFAQGQTWTWNGSTWSQQHPASAPSPRQGAIMLYDANLQGVAFFSGGDSLDDLWRWDGADWSEIASHGAPPGSSIAGAYDAQHDTLVVYRAANLGKPNQPGKSDQSAPTPTAQPQPQSQTWLFDGHTWMVTA